MIEVEDLGRFLGQDLSREPEHDQALWAVTAAWSAVESHCRRRFAMVEDDVLSLRWRPSVFLPDPPVLTISSVLVDGVESHYARDEFGMLWPRTRGESIAITYSHGFETVPDVPRLVAVRLASRLFKNPMGRVSYSAEGMDYSSPADVSPRILTGDELSALVPYRLHRAWS